MTGSGWKTIFGLTLVGAAVGYGRARARHARRAGVVLEDADEGVTGRFAAAGTMTPDVEIMPGDAEPAPGATPIHRGDDHAPTT